MPKEKTISDFIAKDNKAKPFDERVKGFELALKPLVEEWGIVPWAILQQNEQGILPIAAYRDLWMTSSGQ